MNWITVYQTKRETIAVMQLPSYSKEDKRNCMIEHYANLIMNAKSEAQKRIAIDGYNAYSPVPFTPKTSLCKPKFINNKNIFYARNN